MIYASTLTTKGQATIPADVRKKLDLHPGDTVTFEITDQHKVIISKAPLPLDKAYYRALSQTLSEWNSPEDDEAYNDL